MPGQTLLDALEFGVRNYPKSSGGFLQVSKEISYTFDPNINSTVVTDWGGAFVNITGERRVTEVKVNGKDLDLKKIILLLYLNIWVKVEMDTQCYLILKF